MLRFKDFIALIESTDVLYCISEDALLEESVLYRIDAKPIKNFNVGDRPEYLAKGVSSMSGVRNAKSLIPRPNRLPPLPSSEIDKQITKLKKKGTQYFRGTYAANDLRHLAPYHAPRDVASFTEYDPETDTHSITFKHEDADKIKSYSPVLTTLRDTGFEKLATGEHVAKQGKAQVISQERINPLEHLKKIGVKVNFVKGDDEFHSAMDEAKRKDTFTGSEL